DSRNPPSDSLLSVPVSFFGLSALLGVEDRSAVMPGSVTFLPANTTSPSAPVSAPFTVQVSASETGTATTTPLTGPPASATTGQEFTVGILDTGLNATGLDGNSLFAPFGSGTRPGGGPAVSANDGGATVASSSSGGAASAGGGGGASGGASSGSGGGGGAGNSSANTSANQPSSSQPSPGHDPPTPSPPPPPPPPHPPPPAAGDSSSPAAGSSQSSSPPAAAAAANASTLHTAVQFGPPGNSHVFVQGNVAAGGDSSQPVK